MTEQLLRLWHKLVSPLTVKLAVTVSKPIQTEQTATEVTHVSYSENIPLENFQHPTSTTHTNYLDGNLYIGKRLILDKRSKARVWRFVSSNPSAGR